MGKPPAYDPTAETEYLVNTTKGLTKDEFLLDETLKRAFVRSLEIIGEATNQLPPTLRGRYAQVPWREVAGMRDVLSHGYFSVQIKRVWQTVQDDLAPLQEVVSQMLADLGVDEQ